MGRKKVHEGEMRQYGFRMPAGIFHLLELVARARGTDVAAVLNAILAEAAPALQLWLQHQIFSNSAVNLTAQALGQVVPDEHSKTAASKISRKLADDGVPLAQWRTAGAPLAEQEAPGDPVLQARLVEWAIMSGAVYLTAKQLLQEQGGLSLWKKTERETNGGTEGRSGGTAEAKEEPRETGEG
jgi:hypothetical protein